MAKLLMKNYPLFFSLILIGSGINGQPSIKVFGFEQESSRGTMAANVKDENGNPLKKSATQKNYFSYLSLKQKYIITPLQIFIDGKTFPTEANIIETTPIEYINNNVPSHPERTTLVPKTNGKVIQLKITDTDEVKKPPALQKLTNKNEVVVSYMWKQKKYFAILKKLKKLDPVLNE